MNGAREKILMPPKGEKGLVLTTSDNIFAVLASEYR